MHPHSSTDPVAVLRARLETDGFDPRATGPDSWESRCPAHNGSRHNLSISPGDDGRALIHCHHVPPCRTEAIVQAIGLTMSDLYPPRDEPTPSPPANGKSTSKGKARGKPRTHRSPEAALATTTRKLGEPKASWVYHNADESEALQVYRFDFPDPKTGASSKTYRPVHPEPEGWVLGDPPGPLPLYRLSELAAADRVFVSEGEKCCDLVRGLGLACTTSAHGAKSALKSNWTLLAGKAVVILPDHDAPGESYVTDVLGLLANVEPRPTVHVVPLTDLWRTETPIPDGGDIEQWLSEGVPETWTSEQCRAELERVADAAPVVDLDAISEPDKVNSPNGQDPARQTATKGGGGRRRTQSPNGDECLSPSDTLLALGGTATLFHSPDGRAYAEIPVGEHVEIASIRSARFKGWLLRGYYRDTGGAPSREALESALKVLEARAQFDGPCRKVFTRIGMNPAEPGVIYLDLGDEEWRVVRIAADGWQIVDRSPVPFCRASGLLALPRPQPGGCLDALRKHINIGSDDDWRLIVAWVAAALRPMGPYPVLILGGEQGCAKSTLARVLRRLIDPHVTPLRSAPRDERDLMITALASWLIALDNLSVIPPWLSDAFCRLATGGGFSTRQLWTDDEEIHFAAMRPALLNGIDDVATRPDLLDRALLLRLPTIPDDKRQQERTLWESFEAEAPMILGALLDAVVGGLAQLPSVRVEGLPRMADFAVWGEAVGRALGWGEGSFLASYNRNLGNVTESAAESSPVACAVRAFMADRELWKGLPGELLSELTAFVGESTARARDWPNGPRKLTNELSRQAPVLRRLGIQYDRGKRISGGKPIVLTRTEKGPAASSLSSLATPSLENKAYRGDATSDEARADDFVSAPASSLANPWNHRPSDDSDDSDATAGGFCADPEWEEMDEWSA
jgi:hypothetical protein